MSLGEVRRRGGRILKGAYKTYSASVFEKQKQAEKIKSDLLKAETNVRKSKPPVYIKARGKVMRYEGLTRRTIRKIPRHIKKLGSLGKSAAELRKVEQIKNIRLAWKGVSSPTAMSYKQFDKRFRKEAEKQARSEISSVKAGAYMQAHPEINWGQIKKTEQYVNYPVAAKPYYKVENVTTSRKIGRD